MNIQGDSTNAVVNLGIDAIRELLKLSGRGVKVTGTGAKSLLLKSLESHRFKKENEGGLIAAKRILSSKDEIQLLRLNKNHLEQLKERAKEYGISFACIGQKDQEQVKVIFKANKANLMQEVLKDILEFEKFNKQNEGNNIKEDAIDKTMDFDYMGEDKYRKVVKETDLDKLREIKEKHKDDIKELDILIDDEGRFYFKCNAEDKDKLDKVIDELEKKDLDEIINDAQEKAKSAPSEEKKEKKKSKEEKEDR